MPFSAGFLAGATSNSQSSEYRRTFESSITRSPPPLSRGGGPAAVGWPGALTLLFLLGTNNFCDTKDRTCKLSTCSSCVCLDARCESTPLVSGGLRATMRREQLAWPPVLLYSSAAGRFAACGSRPAQTWSATRSACELRSAGPGRPQCHGMRCRLCSA